MFSFETLIYGCLLFLFTAVRIWHCPTFPLDVCFLVGGGPNPTTASSATVWGLNGHRQWLLGAKNWITVIIERSDHSLVTYWGLNSCWWLFTTFWYVISKKRKKSCFLKSEKNEKYVFSNIETHNITALVSKKMVIPYKHYKIERKTIKHRGLV